jgi:hypothetical protein
MTAQELNQQLEKQAEFQHDFFNLDDCKREESDEDEYYSESEDCDEESDLDSQSSLYQLVLNKQPFASLNIMILM